MSETIATIDRFLDVVRKSGLVDAGRLDEAVAAWPDRDAVLPDGLVQTLVDRELLTRWQADQLRKGRYKGFMLGKYRLLGLLGAGGMSSVYLAENTSLQGKVAIKVLPRKFTDKTSYLARFEREARTAWRLSHPNIVRAFDLETAGPIHFIVMEYVDGIDLHAKVKRDGPLPIEEAVDLIRQAALGLHHAHEEGLVHRDVKPANLILNAKGIVKILDLGLASAKDEDGSLTDEHKERVLGTADYLAPEQARQSRDATPAADIYSLGCTLHFLLTGRPPFAGGRKLAERIRAHAMQPPPNLLDERPDLPPEIVTLFLQMMEKHPAARPGSAGEVAERLGRWLERVQAGAGTGSTPLPRRLPRRPVGGPAESAPDGPGSDARREVRPPVVRRGPGSRAGLTPPPRSASRETLPMRRPASRIPAVRTTLPGPGPGTRPPGSSAGGVRAGQRSGGGPAAATASAARPAADHAGSGRRLGRLPPVLLGQPPLVWAAIVGGLVLAAVLGVLVYRKWAAAPAPAPPRIAAPVGGPPPAPESAADPAGPEDQPAADAPDQPVEPAIAPGGQTLDELFGRPSP